MVNYKLKDLFQKVREINSEIETLNSEINSKAKKQDSLLMKSIRKRYMLLDKLKHYLIKIKNFGKGNVVTITYLDYQNNKKVATYTNIRPDEAKDVLKFVYSVNGIKIKILEIKDIPTSLY